MIVYGEFLFLENLITGALLLVLTSVLLGEKIRKHRVLLGATVCGAAGFTVFVATGAYAVPLRIGIATLAVYIGTGAAGFKRLVQKTALFFALTVLSGGTVMALMLWQQIPSLSGAGVFYIPPLTYVRLICFGCLAFGFSYWTVRILRGLRLKAKLCGTARVSICGESLEFSAMVDTGNYLREPFSGKPVALLGKKCGCSLKSYMSDERYTVIPFSSVGTEKGILEGIRCDCMSFGGNEVKNVVLAFYDGDFEESEIVLGRDFFDGGISDEELEELT